MKFTLRRLMLAITCIALFLGGWNWSTRWVVRPGRPVSGVITAVAPPDRAIVSIGFKGRLRVGEAMEIRRGQRVVGTGTVTSLQPDYAVIKTAPNVTVLPADIAEQKNASIFAWR